MEIEIKVKVEDSTQLQKLLEAEGVFSYTNRQIDEYYTPSHRNFLLVDPVVEWVRLRDGNGKFSINYKNWITESDGTSNHCIEHECIIENMGALKEILSALNFKHLVTVDKKRSVWNYKEYEISLDEVGDLGSFIEIEYKGDQNNNVDPKKITDEMVRFLSNLDCGEITRDFRGYPYLLLEKKGLL